MESRERVVRDAQELGILGEDGPAGEFLVAGEAPGLRASEVEWRGQGELHHCIGGGVCGVAAQGGLSVLGDQWRAGGIQGGGVFGGEDSAADEAGAPPWPEIGFFGGAEAGEEVRGAVVVGVHAIFAGVFGLQEHSSLGEGAGESAGLGGGVQDLGARVGQDALGVSLASPDYGGVYRGGPLQVERASGIPRGAAGEGAEGECARGVFRGRERAAGAGVLGGAIVQEERGRDMGVALGEMDSAALVRGGVHREETLLHTHRSAREDAAATHGVVPRELALPHHV